MKEWILSEWFPFALAIGIDPDRFWTLNPRLLKPYISAYKVRRKMDDERDWMLGGYFYEALSAALSGLGKKHVKYRQKPYMADMETFEKPQIELTEYEIRQQTDAFFDKIEMMGNKFVSSQKG